MAASLKRFLAAPQYPEDAERSVEARLFNVVALAVIGALSVALVSQFFFGQTGIPMLTTFAALVLAAGSIGLARLGALRLARAVLPPAMLGACMVVVLVRDGSHDNVMAALGAVLVMGGVLLKRGALAAFTGAVVIMIFAVGYAEINGVLQNRFSASTDWRHVVGLSLFLLFIAVTVRALVDSMVMSLRDVRQSEKRFAGAIETMAEGMILLDMDGKVRICNRAAERILGIPAAEMMRSHLRGLRIVRADGSPYPPEQRPVAITLRSGQSRTGVVLGVVRDGGSIIWISVNSAALFADGSDTPYAVLTTFFDISGLKRAEQELRDHAERLRHLSHRLFEVEESERRRLARELHDRIGPNLTALSLNLSLVRGALPAGSPPKLGTRLEDSETLLGSTAQLVRDVLTEMRPPGLDELGLLAALREHAAQVAQRSGFRLQVRGAEPRPRLPPATEIALFRIAQEALTNIVKHARATAVTVSLQPGADQVTLTITDNGSGFGGELPAAGGSSGMGMTSMRERAEAVGARPRIESAPGQGTRIIVDVPHAAAPQPAPVHEQA